MKQRIQKIKNHLQENKAVYITGGVCLAVGAVGGVLLSQQVNVKQVVDAWNFKYKSPTTNNVTQLVVAPSRRMHPGYVIQCNETGETTSSIRRMADIMGLSRVQIQKHLTGDLENVAGFTFNNLGEAGAAA